MSLRNLDVAIFNSEGAEMRENIGTGERQATVRQTVRSSLAVGPMKWEERAVSYVPDPNIAAEDKLAMYELAMKMKDVGPVDLKAADVELVKRCIKHLMPYIYGQICAALEADIPN